MVQSIDRCSIMFQNSSQKNRRGQAWRLWYLLKSHDGLIYNLESKSLHNFRVAGSHIIRRPIELNYHTAGLWVFNDTEDEHMVEVINRNGNFSSFVTRDSWSTEMRVLLRGSGLARVIGAATDGTF